MHSKAHHGDQRYLQYLKPWLHMFKADMWINGHDHVMQALKDKEGVYYFIVGSS